MYIALAVFASVLGLFVTGAAVVTAWGVYAALKRTNGTEPNDSADSVKPAAAAAQSWLLRWTIADYAAVLLFGCGIVFLLADLAGVAGDRDQYPPYHYAYLLCGFVFSLLGMLFTIVRLAVVIRLASSTDGARPAVYHPHKPNEAQQAE